MYQRDNIPEGDYSKGENDQEGNCDKYWMREIVHEGGYAKSLRGKIVLRSNIPGVIKFQGGKDAGGDSVC